MVATTVCEVFTMKMRTFVTGSQPRTMGGEIRYRWDAPSWSEL